MFNNRLRATRIYRKSTQQECADVLNIGIRSYQRYESGENDPPLYALVELANFLNISIDFLLGRDDYLKSIGVNMPKFDLNPPRKK